MSESPSKKSKLEGGFKGVQDTPEENRSALAKFVFEHAKSFKSLDGRAACVKWVSENWKRAYYLVSASFGTDLSTHAGKVLHIPSDIILSRDARGNIIRISSKDESLNEILTKRILINFGAVLNGNMLVMYEQAFSKNNAGLVVPVVNLEEWSYQLPNDLNTEHKGCRLFTKSQMFNLALLEDDVKHLLTLEKIPIGMWPAILRELSNLRKVDHDFDFGTIKGLDSIITARKSAQVTRSQIALLDSLEAGLLSGATIEEKIKAFEQAPSFKLLSKLKLQRPFTKPLFGSDQKAVKPVPLSSLPSDSNVLLQDLTYDGGYYDNKLGMNMQVYPPGDYRVKAGKTFKVISVASQMKAGDLRRIVVAKEAASKNAGPSGQSNSGSSVDDVGEGVQQMKVDI